MRKGLSPTAAALVVAALLTATGAMAKEVRVDPGIAEEAPTLALVVFRKAPGGAQIMRGNYQSGLNEAGAALANGYRDEAVLLTHMCAAQLKLGEFGAANENCQAVLAKDLPVGFVVTSRRLFAAAHVNHGVVHFMQGDRELAQHEFRRAKAVDPMLRAATRNLAVARQPMRQPRVEVEQTL